MPSKSVMKFHIMKLKCFSESKQITIFLMNLNCNWNTFRWKMKIIFRTSKRRPFFIGTNGPILNVQKTFILGRVPTGKTQVTIVLNGQHKWVIKRFFHYIAPGLATHWLSCFKVLHYCYFLLRRAKTTWCTVEK